MTNNAAIFFGALIIGGSVLSAQFFDAEKERMTLSNQKSAANYEIFQIRSDCAELGRRLRDNVPIVPPLVGYISTHYSDLANRCYVDVKIVDLKIDPSSPIQETLYDGQTQESLADMGYSNGVEVGKIFDQQVKPYSTSVSGDAARTYIQIKMSEGT